MPRWILQAQEARKCLKKVPGISLIAAQISAITLNGAATFHIPAGNLKREHWLSSKGFATGPIRSLQAKLPASKRTECFNKVQHLLST
jgi:hypothetical protein